MLKWMFISHFLFFVNLTLNRFPGFWNRFAGSKDKGMYNFDKHCQIPTKEWYASLHFHSDIQMSLWSTTSTFTFVKAWEIMKDIQVKFYLLFSYYYWSWTYCHMCKSHWHFFFWHLIFIPFALLLWYVVGFFPD